MPGKIFRKNSGTINLPAAFQKVGQTVLIGGSMGTCSYVLCGTKASENLAFSSACHGAGRAMSRRLEAKQWHGRELIDQLASRGILIRSPSFRGIAEEAPLAYKNVSAVVDAAHQAGLTHKVARLEPIFASKAKSIFLS